MRVWTRAAERAAPEEVAQAFDKGVVDGQTKSKQVTDGLGRLLELR